MALGKPQYPIQAEFLFSLLDEEAVDRQQEAEGENGEHNGSHGKHEPGVFAAGDPGQVFGKGHAHHQEIYAADDGCRQQVGEIDFPAAADVVCGHFAIEAVTQHPHPPPKGRTDC